MKAMAVMMTFNDCDLGGDHFDDLLHKLLISVCAKVSKFAAKYHVNKASFSTKFTLNGKCGCKILNKRF